MRQNSSESCYFFHFILALLGFHSDHFLILNVKACSHFSLDMKYTNEKWVCITLPLTKLANNYAMKTVLVVLNNRHLYGQAMGSINTLSLRENSHRFADNILNAFSWMKIDVCWFKLHKLKSVSKGAINNKPALVQIMAWHWIGDNRLSEPMMI